MDRRLVLVGIAVSGFGIDGAQAAPAKAAPVDIDAIYSSLGAEAQDLLSVIQKVQALRSDKTAGLEAMGQEFKMWGEISDHANAICKLAEPFQRKRR